VTLNDFDSFACAVGEWAIANAFFGNVRRGHDFAGRRAAAADAELIGARASDAAGIAWKLDIVAGHVGDERERYGRLFDELHACIDEVAETEADFGHVEAALTVLAYRLRRVGVSDFYVSLARSAALDARELAGKAQAPARVFA